MNHSIKVSSIDEYTAANVLLELNQIQDHSKTTYNNKSSIKQDCFKPKAKPSKANTKYHSISASLLTATPNQIVKKYKVLAVPKDEIMQRNELESPLFSPPSSPETVLKSIALIARSRPPNYEIKQVVQPLNRQQPGKARGKSVLLDEQVNMPLMCPGNLRFDVLRPMKPSITSSYLVRSKQEPMEPAIFLNHSNNQIPSPVQPLAHSLSTSPSTSITRKNITEDFSAATLAPTYITGESNPIAIAKPYTHSTSVEVKLGASKNRIPLRCVSCGCRSTACWRPSWSVEKLCNPCGLRYSRNRARCSKPSCYYIPTKTDICGRRQSKCKKCHSDLIYS